MSNPIHLLIVDDDLDIRELLPQYLSKNGFSNHRRRQQKQMRAALHTATFDMFILDLMLPGDDGLFLCRDCIVGNQKTMPILILTALSVETDLLVGLKMGAEDYLSKPICVARTFGAHPRGAAAHTDIAANPAAQSRHLKYQNSHGEEQFDIVALIFSTPAGLTALPALASACMKFDTNFLTISEIDPTNI